MDRLRSEGEQLCCRRCCCRLSWSGDVGSGLQTWQNIVPRRRVLAHEVAPEEVKTVAYDVHRRAVRHARCRAVAYALKPRQAARAASAPRQRGHVVSGRLPVRWPNARSVRVQRCHGNGHVERSQVEHRIGGCRARAVLERRNVGVNICRRTGGGCMRTHRKAGEQMLMGEDGAGSGSVGGTCR